MRGGKHTPEQIVRKLREAHRVLGEGRSIADVTTQLEISEQTFDRSRNQYGGVKADDTQRTAPPARREAAPQAHGR